MSSATQTFAVQPPTPAELDHLATISTISFVLGTIAFICVLGAAAVVAVKTQLPGRWAVFLGLAVLAAWWATVQVMGGDLEMTFGPVALLVIYTVYSASAVIFATGYLRLCLAVFRQRAGKPEDSES